MRLRICGWAGCSELCEGYYCPRHAAAAERRSEERRKALAARPGGLFAGAVRSNAALYHTRRC